MPQDPKERPFLVLTVDSNNQVRLDVWLRDRIEGLSRRRIKDMIESDRVTVEGRPALKSTPLRNGDRVEIWTEPENDWAQPKPDPSVSLTVLYEDSHLLAVDKPSGIPSVPLSSNETGTLAGAVVARFPECGAVFKRPGDGGLVQRLDLETSGVVLVARDLAALEGLIAAQKRSCIEKKYLAVTTCGCDQPPAVVDAPLAPIGVGGKKMGVSQKGEPAVTRLRLLRTRGDTALVEATIFKGKRHQIRAHLASAGFPILGDALYNPEPAPSGVTRLLLHAQEVRLNHPATGQSLVIQARLPEAFHFQ